MLVDSVRIVHQAAFASAVCRVFTEIYGVHVVVLGTSRMLSRGCICKALFFKLKQFSKHLSTY